MCTIPPVHIKMLKSWSRVTGQPGLTILKNKENKLRDLIDCVINFLIMLHLLYTLVNPV